MAPLHGVSEWATHNYHSCLRRVRSDRTLAAIAAIACIALVLRLWVVWAARDISAIPGATYDTNAYLQLGHSWSTLEQVSSALDPNRPVEGLTWYWPPGYPLWVGAVQATRSLFGDTGNLRIWIGLAQALLGAWTVMLTGLLARRVATSPRAGRVLGIASAAILGFWPGQVLGTAAVMSEGLFTPLLLTATALLLWRRDVSLLTAATSGCLFAGLIVVRYSALPLLLPALAIVVEAGWHHRGTDRLQHTAASAMFFIAGAGLVGAPWIAAHIATTGKPFPDQSGAFNLCSGNHPGASGHFDPGTPTCTRGRSDPSRQRREALAWIGANPAEQPRLLRVRFGDTFNTGDSYALSAYPDPGSFQLSPSDGAVAGLADHWWRVARWVAVVGFGIGLVRWNGRFRRAAVLYAFVILAPLATTGTARYHDPIVPFLAICAASCVALSADLWPTTRLLARGLSLRAPHDAR